MKSVKESTQEKKPTLVLGGTGRSGRRLMTLIFIAALGALVLFVGCSALDKEAKTGERNTANVVSLNLIDSNSYRYFAPELEKIQCAATPT